MIDLLRFTLLSEGTSDRALLPLLRWVLVQHLRPSIDVDGQHVSPGQLPPLSVANPATRVGAAVDAYPCEVLFVHRDADREDWTERSGEIDRWLSEAGPLPVRAVVKVIPIRTSETWLLTDESAIRRAAGKPNGRASLNLPPANRVEAEADPKSRLFEALRVASELPRRRLKAFPWYEARSDVAEHMADPSRLRALSAFRRLEADVLDVCRTHRWD